MRTLVAALLTVVALLYAREPLAQRIAHTDPARRQTVKGVHEGAGEIEYQVLLDRHSLDTNLQFLHRGVIKPKSSMGNHFHNNCEEMYVILDGEAQFTVDGRTSVLRAPAGAPCRVGHSHALYNPTDRPVQFLNVNVTLLRGENDAFNTGDPRIEVPLDPIPVFMAVRFDRSLLKPSGPMQYRRAIPPSVFTGPWAYTDHILLPPGAALPGETHRGVAEVYYVMGGSGTATVGSESAPLREGDALPVQLGERHTIANPGTATLEMLVFGISRERNKEVQ
jgi:mannose-6-phosphate isomerase-like protein (cupin superfamily)